METWVIIAGLIALAIIASAASQQYQIKENFQSVHHTVHKNLAKFHDEYSDQLKDVNRAREKYLRELQKLPGQPPISTDIYRSPYVGPDPTVYGPSTVLPAPTYVPTQPGYVQPQPGYVQPQPGYVQTQPGYVQTQPGYLQTQDTYLPPVVHPVDTYNQGPVGYYSSTYSPIVTQHPVVATSTAPSNDDCYHYAQNSCKSPHCHEKHLTKCLTPGALTQCEAHAIAECRKVSTQDSTNPQDGAHLYNHCVATTKAECDAHGAI